MSGAGQWLMNGLKVAGGAASEYFAPGNPIGLSLMGSGVGGMAGNAAGGGPGSSIGSTIGGMAGGMGGGFDPTAAMSSGAGFDPGAAMGMSGTLDPMAMSMGGAGGGGGMAPGVTPAMFDSGGQMGAMNPQDMSLQDQFTMMQMRMLNNMMNPSMFQQSVSAMGPVGAQLLQNRQQQQLAAMSRQPPSANLQGGPNPVSPTMGAAGVGITPANVGPAAQYMQILRMLGA